MVDGYCVRCHNDVRRTASLELDRYDAANPAAHPEIWEKVVAKLRAGAMPPGGVRRPDAETYEAVAGWLESELDAAWAENPNVGRINAVHRLNRTEYNNAVNDLLGLDVDVVDALPGDETMGGGFDNVADALSISPLHMERYLSVARAVTRLAVGLPPAGPGSSRYAADDARRQNVRMSDDLPLGSRGGMAVRHTFPVAGDYRFRVRLQKNYAGYARGLGWRQELEIRIDGELAATLAFGGDALQHRPVANSYAGAGGGPGWPGSPEWEDYAKFGAEAPLAATVRVEAGSRVVGLSFARDLGYGEEYLLPQVPVQTRGQIDYFNNEYFGMSGVLGVEIDGPFGETAVAGDTRSRDEIFVCEPTSVSDEDACATEILTRTARRAYRRPVTGGDADVLRRFFHMGRDEGGSFDHGIQLGLERILVDPDFLLRIHRDAEGDPYPLSDLEIASRLSFFLWSSIPDEALLKEAEAGRLTDPQVLRAQARRLLDHPRARETLVDDFASQWLKLRELDDRLLQDDIYLEYGHNLREAMAEETRLFLEHNIREDRSVVELLDADYTFVNERLAEHYDIPNVAGSRFRRARPARPRKAGRSSGPRQHPDDHLVPRTHHAGAPRQVDPRKHPRPPRPAAAPRPRHQPGDPRGRWNGANADDPGAARQAPHGTDLRELSPHDRSAGLRAGGLRRRWRSPLHRRTRQPRGRHRSVARDGAGDPRTRGSPGAHTREQGAVRRDRHDEAHAVRAWAQRRAPRPADHPPDHARSPDGELHLVVNHPGDRGEPAVPHADERPDPSRKGQQWTSSPVGTFRGAPCCAAPARL